MAKHDDRSRRPGDAEDLFWDGGEPAAPYEPAGGGRHRLAAPTPDGGETGDEPSEEEESGHSWGRFFEEPIEEPTAQTVSEPYGGRRYAYGREGYFGDPFVDRQEPTGGEGNFGSLYGRAQRDYAHRRRAFYSPPETGPSPYFVPSAKPWPGAPRAKGPAPGKAAHPARPGKRPARHRRRDAEA
jgi:hypothetical protein